MRVTPRDPSSSRRRVGSVSWPRATCSCQTWRGVRTLSANQPSTGEGVRVAWLGLAQAGVCQASAVCLRCSWLVRKYSIGRVAAVTPTPTHPPRRSSALALNTSPHSAPGGTLHDGCIRQVRPARPGSPAAHCPCSSGVRASVPASPRLWRPWATAALRQLDISAESRLAPSEQL